jgi:hypothetical protein
MPRQTTCTPCAVYTRAGEAFRCPDQPRRPGHLPRPRAGGGLPADRPATRGLLRQGIRLPHRRSRDPHPGHFGVTGHRVAGRTGHLRAAGRSFQPRGAAGPRASRRRPLPGLGKIAALGIKVSRHCTYHGVALNVAMDLEPYDRINPCGYAGLQTVDLSTIGVSTTWDEAARVLGQQLSPAGT